MKIVLICGSLGPGRDGVGDYSRRLGGEMIRRNHEVLLLSLNDRDVKQVEKGQQEDADVRVPVIRIPGTLSGYDQYSKAKVFIDSFDPEWLSLQFVPFSFHHFGLPFGIGRRFKELGKGRKWHIMFHELWLGLGEASPVKHRLWGAVQRKPILNLIKCINPKIINTNANPYRTVLARERIDSTVLPLFSNIPLVKGSGWNEIVGPLIENSLGAQPDRATLYLAGIFGSVHPEWSAEETVDILLPNVKRFNKRLVLVFLGKSNLPQVYFDRLGTSLRDRAVIISPGERTSAEISQILQTLDIGVATTPREMIQKSGSAAAMLEHGLQVLVTRDDWHLRGRNSMNESMPPGMLSPEQFSNLHTLPIREERDSQANNVESTASRMLEAVSLHSR